MTATDRTFACVLIALAASQAFFASAPWIDIWVSGLFWSPEGGFWLAGSSLAGFLREVVWNCYIVLLVAALAALFARHAPLFPVVRFPARVSVFVVLLYALGPGLLVNGLLKSLWGRARPAHIQEFGGDEAFTPPFEIADHCQTNCSFVSGEASGAAAFLISALVVSPYIPNRFGRRLAIGTAIVLSVLGGTMRIAKGRHFLSDVVFAYLFVALIAVVLGKLLLVRRRAGMLQLETAP